MAAAPYKAPDRSDSAGLAVLESDDNGQPLYRPEATLWADGPQAVRFFPQSRLFRDTVDIFVVEGAQARQLIYRPDLFRLPENSPLRRLKAGGFTGFRLMNGRAESDWLAFLGASYFRASGPFDQYGASARGVSINSGAAGAEEFPSFTAFWLQQLPGGGVRAYALLDGPSVAGAYRIDSRQTPDGPVQEIDLELYFRRPVASLGLAPLTSMYWRGQTSRPADALGQAHDSDGLELWTGRGERIWRPLNDPPRAMLNSFIDEAPRGFGLILRDREVHDYQHAQLFYEKRPSLWVEPLVPFGKGAVRLLELPTDGENYDNVGVFWTPSAGVKAGATVAASYRLHWCAEAPPITPLCRVVATHMAKSPSAGPNALAFGIDVEGDALAQLDKASEITAAINASAGSVEAIAVYPLPGQKLWRITFNLAAPVGQTVDLRGFLRAGGQTLSETWLYQVQT